MLSVCSPRLSPAAALLGWMVLVPVNVFASLVRGGVGTGSAGAFALAHLVGAGHFLLGGLVSALGVWGWSRLPRPARRLGWVALGGLAAIVGWLAVGQDFEGFVERVEAARSIPPGLLGAVVCAIGVVGVGVATSLVVRRLWPAGLVVAVLLTVLNNLILELDYPGIHLVLGGCAVVAAAVSLSRVEVTAPWRSGVLARRGLAVVLAVAAPAALASVVLRPGEAAWRRLLETSGAFLAPFVSELAPESSGAPDDTDDPWFRSREGLPPTGPSGLSRLPDDGIVMLLVLDALRADVVRRGAPLVAMPSFERLRARSVEFTSARSAASSTQSSMTTIFTGKFYSQLRAKKKARSESSSEDASPRVAETLKEQGVTTFHVVPTRMLQPKYGATRGFDVVHLGEKPSADVLDALEKRLEKGLPGRSFIYLHWMDAHHPYDLGGTEGSPRDAYLRELQIVDQRLGELLDLLDAKGAAARTTLILTADHGEAFGEHDTWEHGKTVYEELLHVPLLIAAPDLPPRVVDTPVSTVDVGATILDLFGQPVPGYWMGETLLPLAHGRKDRVDHPIAAEAGTKLRAFYSTDDVKVVFDRRRKTTEVYDLAADPGETKNLADAAGYAEHIARARRFFAAHQIVK